MSHFSTELLEPEFTVPTIREIFEFIKPVFSKLYLQHECLVMMLIYIERLMYEGEIDIRPENWRPIVFSSLLISSKVLEDVCLTVSDFYSIYHIYSHRSISALERLFTQTLNWKLFISPEQYSHYYFHLKSMSRDYNCINECSLRLCPSSNRHRQLDI